MYWEDPELISHQTSFIFVKFRSKGLTPNLWTITSLEHAVLSSWNTSSSQSPKSIRSITPKFDAFVLVQILSKTMSCYRQRLCMRPAFICSKHRFKMTLSHNHKCLRHCWISVLLLFRQNSVLNLLSLWVWCSALATVCLWWHCQLQNK